MCTRHNPRTIRLLKSQSARERLYTPCIRTVDVRLPGKVNSNSHGARPVHLIITMIKWIRTSRLSIAQAAELPEYQREVVHALFWGVWIRGLLPNEE